MGGYFSLVSLVLHVPDVLRRGNEEGEGTELERCLLSALEAGVINTGDDAIGEDVTGDRFKLLSLKRFISFAFESLLYSGYMSAVGL